MHIHRLAVDLQCYRVCEIGDKKYNDCYRNTSGSQIEWCKAMVTDEQIQEMVRLVYASFENVPYPGDDNIGVHDIEELAGTYWQNLTLEQILHHRDEIGSLTPNAFRYYLPAFLLALLQSADKLDSFPETFIPYLIPPRSISHDKHINKERIFIGLDALSADQKKAVGLCLEMIDETYHRDEWSTIEHYRTEFTPAVEYWSQYVP